MASRRADGVSPSDPEPPHDPESAGFGPRLLGTMPAMPSPPDPARLGRRLGSPVRRATPVPWGDRDATWRLDLDDGRSLAANVMTGPGARRRAERVVAVVARVAGAGLDVATPTERYDDGRATWLVSPWCVGDTGARSLDDDRAEPLARTMGALSRRLAAVDVAGLDLGGPWEDSATLHAAAGTWLDAIGWEIDPGTERRLRDAIARVATESAFVDHGLRPLLRHGDFAPINVIVEPGGRVVLLDFEHARVTALPIDAAWWAWVVDHHHPAAWQRIGATFLAAAGVPDDVDTRRRLADVALLLLLERAAGAGDAAESRRWLDRLIRTAARERFPGYEASTT